MGFARTSRKAPQCQGRAAKANDCTGKAVTVVPDRENGEVKPLVKTETTVVCNLLEHGYNLFLNFPSPKYVLVRNLFFFHIWLSIPETAMINTLVSNLLIKGACCRIRKKTDTVVHKSPPNAVWDFLKFALEIQSSQLLQTVLFPSHFCCTLYMAENMVDTFLYYM